MANKDVFQYISMLVGVLAIIVSLFEKNVRGWLLRTAKKLIQLVSRQANCFIFRSILLFVCHSLLLVLLNRIGLVSVELLIALVLIFLFWLFGVYFIYRPSLKELEKVRITCQHLQVKVQVLTRSQRVELESVHSKWQEFVAMLSSQPGYEVIGAYLSLSKPLHIEDNTLLIGLPEVALKASEGIDLGRVTPLLQNHFGIPYILRPIVYEQSKNDKKLVK